MSVVLYWGGGNPLEEGSATKSFSSTNLGVEPRIFVLSLVLGCARNERPGSCERSEPERVARGTSARGAGPAGPFLSRSRRVPPVFFYLAPAGHPFSFSILLPQGPAGLFLSRSRRVPPALFYLAPAGSRPPFRPGPFLSPLPRVTRRTWGRTWGASALHPSRHTPDPRAHSEPPAHAMFTSIPPNRPHLQDIEPCHVQHAATRRLSRTS